METSLTTPQTTSESQAPVEKVQTVAEKLMDEVKGGRTSANKAIDALSEGQISLQDYAKLAAGYSRNIDEACNLREPPGNKELHAKFFEKMSSDRQMASDLRNQVVQIAIANEGKK